MKHPFRRDHISDNYFHLFEWNNVFVKKKVKNRDGKLVTKNVDDEDTKASAHNMVGVIHCRWSHLPKKEKGVDNKLVVWVKHGFKEKFLAEQKKIGTKFVMVPDDSGGSFPEPRPKKEK